MPATPSHSLLLARIRARKSIAVVLVYLLLSKFIVRGIALGGVKG